MQHFLLGLFFLILGHLGIAQNAQIKQWYQQGYDALQSGKKEQALEYFQKIHAIDSTQTNALENMAFLYNDLGQYEKAAASSVELCRLSPNNAGYYSNACFNYTLANKPAMAEPFGKKAVQLDGQTYNHMLNLAHTYLLRKRETEAQYWYIKALQWIPGKDQFQQSFIGDLEKLSALGLLSEKVAAGYKKGLSQELDYITQDSKTSKLFYSILSYKDKKLSTTENDSVINWKKEFVLQESKASVIRFNVMAGFLHDIGLYEFDKRNRAMAMDVYFSAAERMYINDGDSLGQAKFLLAASNEILTRLKAENRLSKNSAALEYAMDARKVIAKYKLSELESESLQQLSECLFQNKMDLQGKQTLEQLLQWSVRNKDVNGLANAAYGLSTYYKNQHLLDSAFHYNKTGLDLLSSPDISADVRFKLQYRQTELLNSNNQLKESLLYALNLKSDLDKGKDNEEKQSDLCELMGRILFDNDKEDYAAVYLDSAIGYYLDYYDRQSNSKMGFTPAPLSIARELSLRILTYSNARKGNASGTYFFSECLKDNLLKNKLAAKLTDPPFVISFDDAKSALPKDAAAISYAGTKSNLGIVFGFNKDLNKVALLDEDNGLRLLRAFQLGQTTTKLANIFKAIGHTPQDSAVFLATLPLMQYDYIRYKNSNGMRSAVLAKANTNTTRELEEEKKVLARLLYDFYVKPVESIIKDKKKLVICPDFVLQVFPFETLILPDGRYMAEVYDITYTPGFTISHFLNMRSCNSSKHIMAFGNPDYASYNPEQLSGRALDFAILGIKAWTELPGTEKELFMIKEGAKRSQVFSGAQVSETTLKNLSLDGTLKKASILHFALHGIAGGAMSKEDNSLVITEPKGGSEDGLLQFYEAMGLDIAAEMVCLSACETAITQMEDDGSMPTMATAFLAAGAKGVLATNWTIDDEATALFIKDVYTQVLESKLSFAEAVANTKRRFIDGTFGAKYRDPYFWAPFKYYGN